MSSRPGTPVVLVVDDDDGSRAFLVALLKHKGYTAIPASGGAEALALAESRQPDLVVTDILMPEMDGYEFVRRLRETRRGGEIPVVFHTSHYQLGEASSLAEKCGVRHLLEKPSEPHEILRVLESALATRPVPAPPPPAEDFEREHSRVLASKLAEKVARLEEANERLLAHADALEREVVERRRAEAERDRTEQELRALAEKLHSVREQEGTRIAREIHDELGQSLTAMKMDVAWLARMLRREEGPDLIAIAEKTKTMSLLIDATIATVQRISTELRPSLLDELGLAAAIEWQVGEFRRRTGLSCLLTMPDGALELDEGRSTAVFRILQELLTNVARHASATSVSVVLSEDDGGVLLEVGDDGRGIREEEIAASDSLGIVGMRERALAYGGNLEITGGPSGTVVTLKLPTVREARV